MAPKNYGFSGQADLFLKRTAEMVYDDHPLVVLSRQINWKAFDESFGSKFHPETGRPGLSTRLMTGLHYLKHTHNLSDESVLAFFLGNPQWQYFCGQEYYMHVLPCNRSSMTRWRQRIGEEKLRLLLKETIDVALRAKLLKKSELRSVIVDTTVQERAIAFPTDSRLYFKALKSLVRFCEKSGIRLRQTYKRKAKLGLILQSRFARLRKFRLARREERRLRVYLGRVMRDIKRKAPSWGENEHLRSLLEICERIHDQKRGDRDKIYSIHDPEVKCYSKGKAHKRYEFGSKASVAVSARNCWAVGVLSFSKSVHDVLTFKPALDQVQDLTGVSLKRVFVDKGYRGEAHHPEGIEIVVSGQKHGSRYRRRLSRRRSCVEAVIGHLKSDGRLGRNFLLGSEGASVNAVLSGAGFNMRKLLKEIGRSPSFFCFVFKRLAQVFIQSVFPRTLLF